MEEPGIKRNDPFGRDNILWMIYRWQFIALGFCYTIEGSKDVLTHQKQFYVCADTGFLRKW